MRRTMMNGSGGQHNQHGKNEGKGPTIRKIPLPRRGRRDRSQEQTPVESKRPPAVPLGPSGWTEDDLAFIP